MKITEIKTAKPQSRLVTIVALKMQQNCKKNVRAVQIAKPVADETTHNV